MVFTKAPYRRFTPAETERRLELMQTVTTPPVGYERTLVLTWGKKYEGRVVATAGELVLTEYWQNEEATSLYLFDIFEFAAKPVYEQVREEKLMYNPSWVSYWVVPMNMLEAMLINKWTWIGKLLDGNHTPQEVYNHRVLWRRSEEDIAHLKPEPDIRFRATHGIRPYTHNVYTDPTIS